MIFLLGNLTVLILNTEIMKTLKIFGILVIMGVLGFSSVYAQKKVIKFEYTFTAYGWLECTGEFIKGDVVISTLIAPHQWLDRNKKGVVYGYSDEGCTQATGNVYELSQVVPGSPTLDWEGHDGWAESTGKFTLNGKMIGNFHQKLHMSTNANGDVTVDFWEFTMHCK